MILRADFHTHILPGIDDGSQSLEESINMIYQEQAEGVKTIVLTPHFYPQQMYPDSFLDSRLKAMNQLQQALPDDICNVQLIPGAEVLFCPGMSKWEQLEQLTIGNSKYILIEMPSYKWSESTYMELTQIYAVRGLTPILAHIERYLPSFSTKKFFDRLQSLPVLLQCNCDFITDKRTQQLAIKLIKAEKVHLLGSDCHRLHWRPPNVQQAREVLIRSLDYESLSSLKNVENLILQC